jgi:1,4-dihydroxy-2-naphthoate octaprenyltransferase
MKYYFNHWWLAIRPQTLLASIGPIFLGTAMATSENQINFTLFSVTLMCAVSLQVAVNLANDLFDGLSGVDSELRLGPTRAVQAGLISIPAIKFALVMVCTFAVSSGLYLIAVGGWWVFFAGLLSFIGVFSYSAGPFPLASKALGEVTVLIFFGWVSVLGSYYLQTGTTSITVFTVATIAGLYSSAIMLVNNIRDIATDQQAGKYTLAVVLKEYKARKLFALLIACALIIHSILAIQVSLMLWVTSLLLLAPSFILIRKGFKLQGQSLNKLLVNTVKTGFVYCLSVGLCWILFL